MRKPPTPLGPREEDALEQLEAYFETVGDAKVVTQETAVSQLTTNGFERADADDIIEQLILKGYLYEVAEELRILPRSH